MASSQLNRSNQPIQSGFLNYGFMVFLDKRNVDPTCNLTIPPSLNYFTCRKIHSISLALNFDVMKGLFSITRMLS